MKRSIIMNIVLLITISFVGAKEILVGISPIRPPFMYVDENGKIDGYDPAITKAVLEKIGHTAKFVNMSFDGLIPSLITGKIDLIASGLSINEERKKKIDFSDHYNQTGSKIVIKSTDNFKSLSDLRGKKVGAEIGTVQADFAEENKKKYGYEVVIFNAADEMFLDLIKRGGIDAMIENEILALGYNKKNKTKIKVIGDLIKPSAMGFGIKKDNEEFLKQINDVLKEMKKNGEQQKIHKFYFGV
jgi:polar amino acid transport system substrate-binding protein